MLMVKTKQAAYSFSGTSTMNSAAANECTRLKGWSLFTFDGPVPTTEAEVKLRFETTSLASLYNASLGYAKSVVSSVDTKFFTVEPAAEASYHPKGISYFTTYSDVVFSRLVPNRVIETASTKRSLTLLTTAPTANGVSKAHVGSEVIVEFDSPVNVTHLWTQGTLTTSWAIFAITGLPGEEIEVSLGTASTVSGRPSLLVLSSPKTASKFKIVSSDVIVSPFGFLSNTEIPQDMPLAVPTWAVLAHTNTVAHGDYDHSPEIMYIADACGKRGPFAYSANLNSNKENFLYSSRIRLDGWDSI